MVLLKIFIAKESHDEYDTMLRINYTGRVGGLITVCKSFISYSQNYCRLEKNTGEILPGVGHSSTSGIFSLSGTQAWHHELSNPEQWQASYLSEDAILSNK